MRSIILTLILANLSFFYWQTNWVEPRLEKNPVLYSAIPEGAQPLVLLSEPVPVHILSDTTEPANPKPTDENNEGEKASRDDVVLALVGDDAKDIDLIEPNNPETATENNAVDEELINNVADQANEATTTQLADNTAEIDNAETPEPAPVVAEPETVQSPALAEVAPSAWPEALKNLPPVKAKTYSAAEIKQHEQDAVKAKQFLQEQMAKSKDKVATPPPDQPEKPVLDVAHAMQSDPTESPQARDLTPESKDNSIICYKTGSRADKNAVLQNQAWLTQQKIDNKLITLLDASKNQKTRVYLPPFANESTARYVQEQLNQQGIYDHIIIREPPLRHAISLGVYRNGESVKNRLAELRAKGYVDVQIELLNQDQQRYQLYLQLNSHQEPLLKQFSQKFLINLPVKTACAYE